MRWVPFTILMLVLGGCASSSERRFEFSRVLMGVGAKVEVYAPDEASARAAATAAFSRIAALEEVMSDYRPDSEVMRLCERAGGAPVVVSEDLFRVMDLSRQFSEASAGAFNITVGPVVLLWREARRAGVLPDPVELSAARACVGYRLIEMDAGGRTIRLAKPGMRLDLGGIGKGYAADAAVNVMRLAGRPRCLVALAGDVVTGEAPPGRAGWSVAVQRPDGSMGRLVLANMAVSSSGDTEQFVEIGGERYSHIVDPATGVGVTNRIGAVVAARDGATANALATVVCIVGEEPGREIVGRFEGATVEVFAPDQR